MIFFMARICPADSFRASGKKQRSQQVLDLPDAAALRFRAHRAAQNSRPVCWPVLARQSIITVPQT
jgi:hypothetical protein